MLAEHEIAAKKRPKIPNKMRGSIAELTGSLKGESQAHYALLAVLDSVFASLIVAPLVVSFWRSVWELMGVYVFPDDALISAGISYAISILGHVFFTLSQHAFEHYFHPDRNRIAFYLVSRCYTVCFAFVCVNGWRGPWMFLDIYTRPEMLPVATSVAVAVVALACLRALRNCSSTPFVVVTDYVKGYFQVLTMFRVSVRTRSTNYSSGSASAILLPRLQSDSSR